VKTNTVNISFRQDLLKQIDSVAKAEARSRSELIREAARLYLERKRRWSSIFQAAEKALHGSGLDESSVASEIKAVRASRRRNPR
jgi:CopG family transcriptional regulator/antitoxin EndoAI